MKNKIILIFLLALCIIGLSGCRKRSSRPSAIQLMPKHEVKILDEKKDELIVKDKPELTGDYKGIVEIEKPEYQE
jgi:hypothetical protein